LCLYQFCLVGNDVQPQHPPTTNKKSGTRPITAVPTAVPKKLKTSPADEIFNIFRIQKGEQVRLLVAEIQRHNHAMETIARTTAAKTNLEIGVITKSGELNNERKSLELGLQKFSTYESLKKKGVSDGLIIQMFPSLEEFIDTNNEGSNEKIHNSIIISEYFNYYLIIIE
jgi:hypothetical protein